MSALFGKYLAAKIHRSRVQAQSRLALAAQDEADLYAKELKNAEARLRDGQVERGQAIATEYDAMEKLVMMEMKNTEARIRKSYVQRGQAITANDRPMEKLQNQKLAEELEHVARARPGKDHEAVLQSAHIIATSDSRSKVDVVLERVMTMIGTHGLTYLVFGGSLGAVLATGLLHITGEHVQVLDAAGQMSDPNGIMIETAEGFKILTDAPNDGNVLPDHQMDVVDQGNGLFYDNVQQISNGDVMSAAAEQSVDQAGEVIGIIAEGVSAVCIIM